MEHAVDFDGTMFLLDDGSKIVVSRELCKPARQHFMDYLFQKGDFDVDFNFPDFRIYSFDSWYAACLSAGKIISEANT